MTSMLTMAKAPNAGLRRALEADPKVVIAGEDVGKLGGASSGSPKAFRRTGSTGDRFAACGIRHRRHRVGMALPAPVCEIQFDGFVYPAFDQIVTRPRGCITGHEDYCGCRS